MENIAVTRIAYVLPFVDVLQSAGSAVYRELQRWSLPTLLEEQPDRYIPQLPVTDCLRSIEQREGIEDLGFLAFQRWSIDNLDPDVLSQVRSERTLHSRLVRFGEFCRIENPDLELQLLTEGSNTRVIFDLDQPACDGQQFFHWLQIATLIGLVRDSAGSDWQPIEITMRARYTPGRNASSAFPKSRLLTGHGHTSILVPNALLSPAQAATPITRQLPADTQCAAKAKAVCTSDIAARLKLALPAYLGDGYPSINIAAKMAGISTRTLQRKLRNCGTSYLELIRQIRFDAAVELLADPKEKIIDISLALGYEDASHFARAFRRIAALSPREYRNQHVLH